MFVRFIIRRQDEASRSWEGLFTAAYELREQRLDRHESEVLERVLAWFRMHLKVPACLKEPDNQRAICWFRDRAGKPIAYARELVWLLEEHGSPVEMIRTSEPGTILYEDRWQIVAKPRKTGT
ncbi:MAG: hypothetical protein KDA79_02860 [Planctomycetaceae bacterium]|nr:hypothetical protein [Planctomycetaceae bacterium]